MTRIRYIVSPVKAAGCWELTSKARHSAVHATQADAIAAGVKLCRALWEAGTPAELVIKGRDGKIRDNRTYGNDPKGIKG